MNEFLSKKQKEILMQARKNGMHQDLIDIIKKIRGETMITVTCEWCGLVLEPGDGYYEWDCHGFCSEECATEYIMSEVDLIEKVVGDDDRI